MKMKLGITWCYLLFMLINHKYSNLFVSAKNLETQNLACHEHVSDFFKSFLNVTIQPSNKVGKWTASHVQEKLFWSALSAYHR